MKKLWLILVGAVFLLAAAYHALMYYDNNFRYGRMRETPAVKPHEEPLTLMEEGVVPVSGGEALLRADAGALKPVTGHVRPGRRRTRSGRLPHLLRPVPRCSATTAGARWGRASSPCRPTCAAPPCSPSRRGRFSSP